MFKSQIIRATAKFSDEGIASYFEERKFEDVSSMQAIGHRSRNICELRRLNKIFIFAITFFSILYSPFFLIIFVFSILSINYGFKRTII
jgi:hypothetical protein